MWYVYVLTSVIDKKHYISSTDDISRALSEHNSGQIEETKDKTPLILETYITVKDRVKAAELVEYFKTPSGRAILNKRIL